MIIPTTLSPLLDLIVANNALEYDGSVIGNPPSLLIADTTQLIVSPAVADV